MSQESIGWKKLTTDFTQLTFGDGYFGKALKNGSKINVNYVMTNGVLGNGVAGTTILSLLVKFLTHMASTSQLHRL
jgi:hypothetical protein